MKALRVISESGVIGCRVESLPVPEPGPGEVLIRGRWSSVNYKDALAATGAGKIMKSLPLIGGVDIAGVVEASGDARFKAGDAVLVTGYGLGVEADGGFAEYARVPADWVVPLPDGLSAFQSMALGTAGFTAGLAVMKMELMGLTPGAGPVLVSGATGGVGSLAVDMLAGLGYEVVAISGKPEQTEYLRGLGAADRKSTRLNSSHNPASRMPSSA
jgi:NADPH2:quinone reductase